MSDFQIEWNKSTKNINNYLNIQNGGNNKLKSKLSKRKSKRSKRKSKKSKRKSKKSKRSESKLIVETYEVGEKIMNKDAIVTKDYNKTFIFNVFANDIYIRGMLKKGYFFEKKLLIALTNLLPKDGYAIDVGANIGTISIPLAEKAYSIITFEPQKELYEKCLIPNIKINNKSKIIDARQKAVGHFNGRINLDIRLSDDANVMLDYTGKYKLNYSGVQIGIDGPEVDMITIDSLNVKRLDLLKVDVEGAEPLVLYGARETIKRCKPVIAFEKNYQYIFTDAYEALKLTDEILNFDIVNFAENNGYDRIIGTGTDNYILIPKGKDISSDDENFICIPVNKLQNDMYKDSKLKKLSMKKIKYEN